MISSLTKNIKIGLIAGVVYGFIDVLLMIPLDFPDKTAALSGAFVNRFAIGFLIPVVSLPMPGWLKGLLLGLLLSLPDAIITHSYVPILGTGLIGGLIIGIVTDKFVNEK